MIGRERKGGAEHKRCFYERVLWVLRAIIGNPSQYRSIVNVCTIKIRVSLSGAAVVIAEEVKCPSFDLDLIGGISDPMVLTHCGPSSARHMLQQGFGFCRLLLLCCDRLRGHVALARAGRICRPFMGIAGAFALVRFYVGLATFNEAVRAASAITDAQDALPTGPFVTRFVTGAVCCAGIAVKVPCES